MTASGEERFGKVVQASRPRLDEAWALFSSVLDPTQPDPAHLVAALDTLAGQAPPAGSPHVLLAWLVQQGFRGVEGEQYYTPASSLLGDVLATRRGIPISLAVVAAEVGRRLGHEVEVVGLPGHVVARWDGGGTWRYADLFHGALDLQAGDLIHLVPGADPAAVLPEAWLAALTPKQVLTRMLANLRGVYGRIGQPGKLAQVLDLLVLLAPWDPDLRQERGLLLAWLGRRDQALEDLAAVEAFAPERLSDEAKATLQALRGAS